MKSILLLLVFIIASLNNYIYGFVEIPCTGRYQYQVYHPAIPPSYFQGSRIGQVPIAGTGQAAYYETKWSNNYSLTIKFFSGYEINNLYGSTLFNDNLIIGLVSWSNGGYSLITIDDWETELKTITKEEILFDTEGNRIHQMEGHDDEGRLWNLYF